jgi:hypothetical protein
MECVKLADRRLAMSGSNWRDSVLPGVIPPFAFGRAWTARAGVWRGNALAAGLSTAQPVLCLGGLHSPCEEIRALIGVLLIDGRAKSLVVDGPLGSRETTVFWEL